jgi:hypothetical protein
LPELTAFAALLALAFLDECRRAALEQWLDNIEELLRRLIVAFLLSGAISVALFLLLGGLAVA